MVAEAELVHLRETVANLAHKDASVRSKSFEEVKGILEGSDNQRRHLLLRKIASAQLGSGAFARPKDIDERGIPKTIEGLEPMHVKHIFNTVHDLVGAHHTKSGVSEETSKAALSILDRNLSMRSGAEIGRVPQKSYEDVRRRKPSHGNFTVPHSRISGKNTA